MIAVNPVLAREMRSRMRGARAAVLLTFWLLVNGLVLAVVYIAAENQAEQQLGFGGFANTIAIGRGIYGWTLFAMLLLMLLIVPAQAAGAIAGERERQTLVPLQVTMLSPWRILVGKVTASVAFLVLLVVAGLPLLAVGYLVGGISIADVLIGAAVVLFTGLLVAGMCIAISTFTRRVQSATVLCYALVLVLTVGSVLLYGAYAVLDQSRGVDQANPPAALLVVNPVVFVSSVVGDDISTELTSPFDGIRTALDDIEDGDSMQVGRMGPNGLVGPNGQPLGQVVVADRGGGTPLWLWSGLALTALSVGGLALAARALRTPAETER